MSFDSIGTVVVTGVSSGIGEATARHLMLAGYKVFGSVRKETDAARLQDTLGDKFVPMLFDMRDKEAIKQAAQRLAESLEGESLTALVNNAGLAGFGPLECLDDDTFDEIIAVNLLGTRYVTNAFLPMLRAAPTVSDGGPSNVQPNTHQSAGKIINISSLSGILNTPMNGAYCVSKHALESLGEIYRRELLPAGIDVVSIRSGPIQSQIWEKNKEEALDYENPDYQLMSENAQAIMRDAAKNALPASVIAELVLDIIENRKRKLSYELGRGSFFAVLLSKWLPSKWVDRLLNRALTKTS